MSGERIAGIDTPWTAADEAALAGAFADRYPSTEASICTACNGTGVDRRRRA